VLLGNLALAILLFTLSEVALDNPIKGVLISVTCSIMFSLTWTFYESLKGRSEAVFEPKTSKGDILWSVSYRSYTISTARLLPIISIIINIKNRS
jgi:hypothetical protein